MALYIVFDTLQEARDYRQEHRLGGWIFACDDSELAFLFPPHLTPSSIFRHPLTRGRGGRLVGSS